MNWVKKNPTMAAIIAIAVVVIIILIVMTATRKKSDNDKNEEVGGSGKPEIEVLSMDKMLLPMDKTETYTIQEGYTIMELAKNIDFTLRWNNKGGMESIKTMIFKRFSPNGTLVSSETIQRAETNPYFVPFSKNNSYVFKGSVISSNTNLVGVNKLQILYVLEGETAEKVLFDSSVSFIGSNQVEITDEDLSIIEITEIIQTITYTPTVSSFSISKNYDDTDYELYPGGGETTVHSAIFGTEGLTEFSPAEDVDASTYTSSLFYIYFPEKGKYLGLSDADTRCHPSYLFKSARRYVDSGDVISACFDGDGCLYPTRMGLEQGANYPSCIDTSLPNPYIPPPQAAAATDRANAIKFKITNSTVADRYRFQSTNGLFLGMHSGTVSLIDINNENTTETMYNTINIRINQRKSAAPPTFEEMLTYTAPDMNVSF